MDWEKNYCLSQSDNRIILQRCCCSNLGYYMELTLEYGGVTLTIVSDEPVNLAGLQDFLSSMAFEEDEEEDELFEDWDE